MPIINHGDSAMSVSEFSSTSTSYKPGLPEAFEHNEVQSLSRDAGQAPVGADDDFQCHAELAGVERQHGELEHVARLRTGEAADPGCSPSAPWPRASAQPRSSVGAGGSAVVVASGAGAGCAAVVGAAASTVLQQHLHRRRRLISRVPGWHWISSGSTRAFQRSTAPSAFLRAMASQQAGWTAPPSPSLRRSE